MIIRKRTALLASFLATFLLAFISLMAAAHADSGLPLDVPDPTNAGTWIERWWSSGALAAPLAALTFGLLIVLERLSLTRLPGLGFLRRGSTRAYLSLAVGNLTVLLPAIASGSITGGGFATALLGGMLVLRPGGGEARPASEDVPT